MFCKILLIIINFIVNNEIMFIFLCTVININVTVYYFEWLSIPICICKCVQPDVFIIVHAFGVLER